MTDKISKTDDEWKKELTQEQYDVCRNKDTERPFTCIYWDCKDEGIYRCSCCGLELFKSETKFDSGTGWPSFFKPANSDNIEEKKKTKKKNKESNNLKNVSIPKGISIDSLNLEKAKFLCSLPKSLGINPENEKEILLHSALCIKHNFN